MSWCGVSPGTLCPEPQAGARGGKTGSRTPGQTGDAGAERVERGASRSGVRNQRRDGSYRAGGTCRAGAAAPPRRGVLLSGVCPVRPAEAGVGAAGAGRAEAELRAAAVPVPARRARLPALHPRALRALPGPLPLPAAAQDAGEGFSCPWRRVTPASGRSWLCPRVPQLGTAMLWGTSCCCRGPLAPRLLAACAAAHRRAPARGQGCPRARESRPPAQRGCGSAPASRR